MGIGRALGDRERKGRDSEDKAIGDSGGDRDRNTDATKLMSRTKHKPSNNAQRQTTPKAQRQPTKHILTVYHHTA